MPSFLQRSNPTLATSAAERDTPVSPQLESNRLSQLMDTPGVLYLPAPDGSTQVTSNFRETSRVAEMRQNLRMRLILGSSFPQTSQASST